MESIPEDVTEAGGVTRDDPAFPPLFYIETDEENGFYTRDFEMSLNAFPPYLQPIPHYMKLFMAMDPTDMQSSLLSAFPPLFFYPASEPLPPAFRVPYSDRPKEFYVSLTHDSTLFNLEDPFPKPRIKVIPHKVLRSTELLESVLLLLDQHTLLTSIPRVSKAWKGIVDGSTALQRKLYFKPDSKTKLGLHPQAQYVGDDDREKFPVINPLLARHFKSCFFSFGRVYGWLRRAESFYELNWTRHRHELEQINMPWERASIWQPMLEKLDGRETLEAAQHRERFTRSGASWRNMLVCQPPIFDFGVMIFQPDNDEAARPQRMEKAIIKAHDMDVGLCMGQLYDFVQERASHHPLSSMWFRLIWFEPQGPWTSDLCRDTAKELAQQTSLIIEMFHVSDLSAVYHPRDPPRPENFDRIFQSRDFKPHHWTPDATKVDSTSRGYEPLSPLDGDQHRIWCGFAIL